MSVPGIATVFEACGFTLAQREEHAERSREEHPWTRWPANLQAHDVAITLGLSTVVEVEPEWCESCRKLERPAAYYRSVSSGIVAAVGRRMKKLVAAGLLAEVDGFPSLYRITAEGEALLDDARDAAIAHLREVLE